MDRDFQSEADMFLRLMSNAPMTTLYSVANSFEPFFEFSSFEPFFEFSNLVTEEEHKRRTSTVLQINREGLFVYFW